MAAQRARLLVFDFFAGLLFFDLAAALFVVSLATAAVLLHLVAWSRPSNAWISQNALQPWQYLIQLLLYENNYIHTYNKS